MNENGSKSRKMNGIIEGGDKPVVQNEANELSKMARTMLI